MTNKIAALIVAITLAACGGGGGGAGTSPFGNGSGSDNGGTGDGGSSTTPAELLVTLNKTSVNNSGSEVVAVTVMAVNAARVAMADVPISLSVDNNAVAVYPTKTTDASGSVTATVSIGSDRSNRVVSVTATSGAVAKLASFQVTGSALQATLLPAVVVPGSTGNKIQYRLVDASAAPMVGQVVTVSGAGITGGSGVTGINGDYEFSYSAPATAQTLEITASSGGVTAVQTVIVQSAAGGIPPVTQAINSASIEPNPSVVNTGGASNIRALFVGANNAPITNVRARFDLAGDANSIGGTLASGTSLVYSNALGVASTMYTAGSRSSPTNGLTVRVCYSATDFPDTACPNEATKTLTVVSDPLAVSIGTNETLANGPTGLTYVKQFVVLVVDSSGQAKGDVQITPSIDLKTYTKGVYVNPTAWTQVLSSPACLNEDVNRNGILEVGEDTNNNTDLDPRKSDVAITMVTGPRTNANGTAVLQIEYPKNVASWESFEILVTASGVAGTEGRTSWRGVLPVPIEAIKAEAAPAFILSPYGRGSSCTDPN